MSTYFILRDPNLFPEPLKFQPERWLLNPDDLRKQEKYLVPASKGTLGCVGQKYDFIHDLKLKWTIMTDKI